MAGNLDRLADRSSPAQLDSFAEPVRALLARIHQQCRDGWDINIVTRLHAQVAPLVAACEQAHQPQVAEQLRAIDTAMVPAHANRRLPSAGSTALIAARVNHLRNALPVAATVADAVGVASNVAALPSRAQRRALCVVIASRRASLAREVATELAANGMQVHVLAEPLAVLERLSHYLPDCVLVDQRSDLVNGSELADMIHERPDFACLPVLLLGADADADAGAGAGADAAGDDTLATTLHGGQWPQAVRDRIAAAAAAAAAAPAHEAPRQRVELGAHHGRYQRATLLKKLDAAINRGAGRNGGLLDIGMVDTDALHARLGTDALLGVLEQLGDLITGALENGDTLATSGPGYLLFSATRDRDHLHALASTLRGMVEHERFGASALPLRISVGGCSIDGSFDTADGVLAAALGARHASVGGIAWHEPERDRVNDAQVKAALRSGRVHLVFQAIVGLTRPGSPRYQALLRLRDDHGHVHTAAELFALPRDAQLVAALDQRALEQALRLLSHAADAPEVPQLFVHQSCASLLRRDCATRLKALLQASGVRADRLVLTLRCGEASAAPRELIVALAQVKALGLGLCLSDVDRNAASGHLIDCLPLDYLKLSPARTRKPGAIVPLAHARGIRVIAPQIEDRQLLRELRKSGVDFVQGHALSHPTHSLAYRFDGAATQPQ